MFRTKLSDSDRKRRQKSIEVYFGSRRALQLTILGFIYFESSGLKNELLDGGDEPKPLDNRPLLNDDFHRLCCAILVRPHRVGVDWGDGDAL
jgi:hypothetical protein